MHRWQVLLALLAVSAGSVLLAAGPGGLARLGTMLVDNAGWLLIAVGVIALLAAIAPRGTLLGPLVLILAGLVLVGWPRVELWTLSGGVITVGGGLFLLRKANAGSRNIDPVMRRWTAFIPWTIRLTNKDLCPYQLFLRPVGTKLTVDLGEAEAPPRDVLEVTITCWAGWVELKVPAHWTVIGGRLTATALIAFDGILDQNKPYPDPSKLRHDEYIELTRKRFEKYGSDDLQRTLVVVHVMGLGGGVTLVH